LDFVLPCQQVQQRCLTTQSIFQALPWRFSECRPSLSPFRLRRILKNLPSGIQPGSPAGPRPFYLFRSPPSKKCRGVTSLSRDCIGVWLSRNFYLPLFTKDGQSFLLSFQHFYESTKLRPDFSTSSFHNPNLCFLTVFRTHDISCPRRQRPIEPATTNLFFPFLTYLWCFPGDCVFSTSWRDNGKILFPRVFPPLSLPTFSRVFLRAVQADGEKKSLLQVFN